MMQQWQRTAPLTPSKFQKEVWTAGDKEFLMNITYGKSIDIISLKKGVVDDFAKSVACKQTSATQLLTDKQMVTVSNCPICGEKTNKLPPIFKVYGSSYLQCKSCSHNFLGKKLSEKALTEYFKNDHEYRATYNDREIAETRVAQVATPKLEWTLQQFNQIYGRPPKGILDVGAGSGHFIYACEQKKIPAKGIEISPHGRNFCKQVFDIEILDLDFIKDFEKISTFEFEIITFWGVIECVTNPSAMIDAARRSLKNKQGMIVAEVPRWDALSTTVQKFFPDSVIRHLDPIGHIHIFSDRSLLQLLLNNEIKPVAAWYFGMDAYELITQIAFALNNENIIDELRHLIPELQSQFDQVRLSDEIVIAGIINGEQN